MTRQMTINLLTPSCCFQGETKTKRGRLLFVHTWTFDISGKGQCAIAQCVGLFQIIMPKIILRSRYWSLIRTLKCLIFSLLPPNYGPLSMYGISSLHSVCFSLSCMTLIVSRGTWKEQAKTTTEAWHESTCSFTERSIKRPLFNDLQ